MSSRGVEVAEHHAWQQNRPEVAGDAEGAGENVCVARVAALEVLGSEVSEVEGFPVGFCGVACEDEHEDEDEGVGCGCGDGGEDADDPALVVGAFCEAAVEQEDGAFGAAG